MCTAAAEAGGGRGRPWSGSLGFGGNDWIVPILVACILAYFIIAASTLVLLVLYCLNRGW